MPGIPSSCFEVATSLSVACSEALHSPENLVANYKDPTHRPSVEISMKYTMDFCHLFFALTWMALSSAYASSSPDSACDLSGIDVDGAITKLIAKFPEYQIVGPEKYYPVFAGFEISGFNVSGFHKLQQYGPAIPYCLNSTRRVQVDLLNAGDVVIATPWRHCSGHQGTLSLRSRLSRFTVQFHVGLSEEDKQTKLAYQGPTIPVITVSVQINVDGAGHPVNTAAGILSMIFPEVTMEMWNEQFYYSLSQALHRALN